MAKTFSAPPFRRGKTSRVPPSCFVAPPLPVISDQSLSTSQQGRLCIGPCSQLTLPVFLNNLVLITCVCVGGGGGDSKIVLVAHHRDDGMGNTPGCTAVLCQSWQSLNFKFNSSLNFKQLATPPCVFKSKPSASFSLL